MKKLLKNAYILAFMSALCFQPAIAQEQPKAQASTSNTENAEILTLINELEENLQWLYGAADSMYLSLEKMPENMDSFLKQQGYDTTKISEIPYYQNPFVNMHWDLYNVGVRNSLTKNTILLKTLKLKYLEQLATTSDKDKKDIETLKNELKSLEEQQEYAD